MKGMLLKLKNNFGDKEKEIVKAEHNEASVNNFSFLVDTEYLARFEFGGHSLDAALRTLLQHLILSGETQERERTFLQHLILSGETQERERILGHFSRRYLQCNPNTFKSEDSCHTLTCAMMLLNTDLHRQNTGRKMTMSEFIENLAELNDGENFPTDILHGIFHSIRDKAIEFDIQDAPKKKSNGILKVLAITGSVLVGATICVAAAPIAIAAAGFTSGGIAAGSIAAGMMSSAAIANGGMIAAGSTVAILQSVGVVGLGAAGTAAVAGVGGAAGGTIAGVAIGIRHLASKKQSPTTIPDGDKPSSSESDEKDEEPLVDPGDQDSEKKVDEDDNPSPAYSEDVGEPAIAPGEEDMKQKENEYDNPLSNIPDENDYEPLFATF